MFKFFTRHEEQQFENKDQAIDFYNRGSLECEGAESDRYAEYVDELRESDNLNEVKYMFSGIIKQVLIYNSSKDCLQPCQNMI